MREIVLTFTIAELVKLVSCCNHAIVNCNEEIRANGEIKFTTNGVTARDSLVKIWSVKDKLKYAMIKHMSAGSKSADIIIKMDITDVIKLNGCCNSLMADNEKMIDICGSDTDIASSLKQEIQIVMEIKNKIKRTLNSIYGDVATFNVT